MNKRRARIGIEPKWLILSGLLLGLFLLRPATAEACATCATGDPTLTSVGLERPFAGRLRISSTGRIRSEEQGDPMQPELRSQEIQVATNVIYVPLRWLTLGLTVPVVHRDLHFASGRRQTSFGLGDISALGRFAVWQDREQSPEHLLSFQTAFAFPTSPTVYLPSREGTSTEEASREVASADLQTGRGSWTPSLSANYAYFGAPFALFVSVTVQYPFGARFDERANLTLLSTLYGQWQPWESLAIQLGFDGRFSEPNTDGVGQVANTGGAALFISPGIAYSPWTDFLMAVTVRIPIVGAYEGQQYESPLFLVSLAYDFET